MECFENWTPIWKPRICDVLESEGMVKRQRFNRPSPQHPLNLAIDDISKTGLVQTQNWIWLSMTWLKLTSSTLTIFCPEVFQLPKKMVLNCKLYSTRLITMPWNELQLMSRQKLLVTLPAKEKHHQPTRGALLSTHAYVHNRLWNGSGTGRPDRFNRFPL